MLDALKNIDLFGKEPELYYKGNSTKTSWIGRILTLLYIAIYIAFFVYKIVRMVNRVDVTFYENNVFTGEVPHVTLNTEIFYGGIGLKDPYTNQNYINESIYQVKAVFKSGKRIDDVWYWDDPIDITPVPCKLEYFGSKYHEIFKNKHLERMYCLDKSNITGLVLQGYSNLNVYSYFDISFHRCVNGTSNITCMPIGIIDRYLTAAEISCHMQDVDLTPQDYESPVKQQEKDIPGPLYRDLHQESYAYMQVTMIETEENIFGFEALSNIKTETHLKYDHAWVISSPNIYGNYYQKGAESRALSNIRIQLANTVLTQKRVYTQFIDVLGDVGGLMEVIFSLFRIFSSFIVGILYDESLVNNLFIFDLEKKVITMKNINKKYKDDSIEGKNRIKKILKESIMMNYDDKNGKRGNNNIKFKKERENINLENEINNSGNKSFNTNIIIYGLNKKFEKDKFSDNSNRNCLNKDKKQQKRSITFHSDINNNHINILNEKLENKNQPKIVNKISINKFLIHLCFCWVRSTKNLKNILLDEGMTIIMEKLEIFNIFKKMYKEDKREYNYEIKMSDKAKKELNNLYNEQIFDISNG